MDATKTPVPPPPDALIWRANEVAYVLRLSVHQVYRMVNARQLPSFKQGAHRCFHPQQIRAYVDRQAAVGEARDGA